MSKAPICATYILSNNHRSIYVGATQDLERRMEEHKTKVFEDGHTARYNIDRLVWYQECADWNEARAREVKLKNMHREGRVALVNEMNPKWVDLSLGLFGWSSNRFKRVAE